MAKERESWIAVAGDVHGELDVLASLLERFEQATGNPIDLILQVGDLEPHRDERDLESMIATESGKRVGDFPKYARGDARLPAALFFIGGNHEPWAFLEESGRRASYLAPGFVFMGRSAGPVTWRSIKIAGLSGIYHPRHSERPREDAGWERATYFAREDVAALLALERVDILLLHDWPAGVLEEKDRPRLPGLKPGEPCGNDPARLLVGRLKPRWVFCGHRHVAYARDLAIDGSTVRVRCLADVPRGREDSVAFLRVKDGEIIESAPLLELEAFATSSSSRRTPPKKRGKR